MKGGENMDDKKMPMSAATLIDEGADRSIQGSTSHDSIPQPKRKVKNTLRALRLQKELSAEEMVAVVQGQYPKYDKTLQSKCEHSDEYGVTLVPKAMAMLIGEFGELPKTKPDVRTLNNRLYVRLGDWHYEAFRRQMKADGFKTVQGCLSFLISQYIEDTVCQIMKGET